LAERYPAAGARRARFEQAVEELHRDRFLLDEDAAKLRQEAATAK
jgi:hypothetical protein